MWLLLPSLLLLVPLLILSYGCYPSLISLNHVNMFSIVHAIIIIVTVIGMNMSIAAAVAVRLRDMACIHMNIMIISATIMYVVWWPLFVPFV